MLCPSHTIRRLIGVLALAAFLVCMSAASVLAASQSFYPLNAKPSPGMLMSVSADPKVVELASDKNASSLVGVVATADNTALNQQPGQISVSTDGVADVLVSTLAGDIKIGDKIAPSSVLGIGAKTVSSGWIVGTAQGRLDGSTKGAIKTTVTDNKGAKHTVVVGSIPLIVKVGYFTVPNPNQNSWVPSFLQSAANNLAGKHVSSTALLLSFLLILVGLAAAALVVNSAVRGGMLAIARQPLSKALIQRKVLQSFGMAVLLLLVVLGGAVLLLRIL